MNGETLPEPNGLVKRPRTTSTNTPLDSSGTKQALEKQITDLREANQTYQLKLVSTVHEEKKANCPDHLFITRRN